MAGPPIKLEVHDRPDALFDEPFAVAARGADLSWRARFRDDDERVWRAAADDPACLSTAWRPGKAGAGDTAALQSLRPVRIDVRVEAPDGRAAARTLTRRLLADGVRARRWRDGLTATLYRPAGDPVAAAVLDATARPELGPLAGALLASRGVLVVAVTGGALELAAERLVAVAAPGGAPAIVPALAPPNSGAAVDAAAWDALLAGLGAAPRRSGYAPSMSDDEQTGSEQTEAKREGIERGGPNTPPPPGGGAEKGDAEPDPEHHEAE